MQNLKTTFVLLAILLLTQCNNEKENEVELEVVGSIAATPKLENLVLGKWMQSNSIWDYSEIELKKDSTFTYFSKTCYGIQFDEGQWKIIDNAICVTSSKSAVDRNDSNKTNAGSNAKLANKEVAHADDTKLHTKVESEIFTELPGPNDTIRCKLGIVKLEFHLDTLYVIAKFDVLKGAKFHKLKFKVQ
jgi:hypothetical protein